MNFLQIYHWVCPRKDCENWLSSAEVMGKSLGSCFFRLTVHAQSLINMVLRLLGRSTAEVTERFRENFLKWQLYSRCFFYFLCGIFYDIDIDKTTSLFDVKLRIHDATGCTAGCTTWLYKRLCSWWYNQSYRVNGAFTSTWTWYYHYNQFTAFFSC